MNRSYTFLLLAILLGLMLSCGEHDHSHDQHPDRVGKSDDA